MNDVTASAMYKAFGLRISSELHIPELSAAYDDEADVWIRFVDLSNWKQRLHNRNLIVEHNVLVVHVAGVAVFAVEEGRRIGISPEANADVEIMRQCVTSTCMAAILLQRGMLALHGSAVMIEGSAYAIVGVSGAGKSTLAAALMQRGYSLLSDEIIAVSLSGGSPVVTPSYPAQYLWSDSLQRLGLMERVVSDTGKHPDKLRIAVDWQFQSQPIPLRGVMELEQSQTLHPIAEEVSGLGKLRMFMQHTFRPFLIPAFGMDQWHFSFVTELADHISAYQLRRPSQQFLAAEVADTVVDTVRKEVVNNG